MSKPLVFIYGLASYAVGLGGLLFFMLYAGAWDFLPLHIDSRPAGPIGAAIATNLLLVGLFGLQHSVMARQPFKNFVLKFIPHSIERSTYVLFSGVVIALMCFYWQPIAGSVWDIKNPLAVVVLRAIHVAGWLILVAATFEIDHFDLMGLKQVFLSLTARPEPEKIFVEKYLYRIVRHPIQLGVLIGVWVTPTMTMTHLMFAGALTAYIFIGLHFEEKALLQSLGKTYADYQQRVPRLLPFLL